MTLRSRIWSPMATPILGLGCEGDGMVSTGEGLGQPWFFTRKICLVKSPWVPPLDGPLRRGTEELDP